MDCASYSNQFCWKDLQHYDIVMPHTENILARAHTPCLLELHVSSVFVVNMHSKMPATCNSDNNIMMRQFLCA